MTQDEGWSRESVIAALERAVDEFGPDFTQVQYESLTGVPGRDAIRERFGGIHEAKRELGIESSPLTYADSDCLAAIRQVSEEVGHPASAGEYIEAVVDRELPSRPILVDRFGSYPDARELAIEQADSEFKTWAYTTILERARERTVGPLTKDKFEAVTNHDADAVADWLGGGDWLNALSVAGVGFDADEVKGTPAGGGGREPEYSQDECRDAIGRAAENTAGTLSVTAYDGFRDRIDAPLPSASAIIDRFGTWNRAKLEAGLGASKGYGGARWTRAECAAAIAEAGDGDPSELSIQEYTSYRKETDRPLPSKNAIAYNEGAPFESWPEAVDAARSADE